MGKEFDFYLMGQRHANDDINEIERLRIEITEKYGPGARRDFENGIASYLDQYRNIKDDKFNLDDYNLNYSTKNFEIPNLYNVSYTNDKRKR